MTEENSENLAIEQRACQRANQSDSSEDDCELRVKCRMGCCMFSHSCRARKAKTAGIQCGTMHCASRNATAFT